jgi:hypothetical protein
MLDSPRTVTVRVDAAWAKTGGGGITRDATADDTANGKGSDETVYVDNQGACAPHPDWIILAHELCGHAPPGMQGTHPEWRPGRPGYDPKWHQKAIDAEHRIRDEHGLPPR